MKARDVILQLRAVLPKHTDLFTNEVAITSITPSGTTTTVVTSAPHGRVDGNIVGIVGTKSAINITSITRVGKEAIVVTESNHDITENYQYEVEIVGATEFEFNSTFKITSVKNRRTFSIEVEDSGATSSTGNPVALGIDSYGFNGYHPVTVIDPTTLTYELPRAMALQPHNVGSLHYGHRITGSTSIEDFINGYTSQDDQEYYICVVLGEVTASKDRHTNNDGTHVRGAGQALLQHLQQTFSVYVFVPTKQDIVGMDARDSMEDMFLHLTRSLAGVKFDTYMSASKEYMVTFVSHGVYDFKGSYYIHEFIFEQFAQHTYGDTVGDDFNVAFRDIKLGMNFEFDVSN